MLRARHLPVQGNGRRAIRIARWHDSPLRPCTHSRNDTLPPTTDLGFGSTVLSRLRHISVSVFQLRLLVAVLMFAAVNGTYWSRATEAFAGSPGHLVQYSVAAFGVILFSIALFTPPKTERWSLAILLVLGAVASYFLDYLGAVIDRDMIHNAMTTTKNEARHLLTFAFLSHVAIYGILPASVLLLMPIRKSSLVRATIGWAGSIVLAFLIFGASLAADFKTMSSLIREHRELDTALIPFKPLEGMVSFARQTYQTANMTFSPIGTDAQKGPRLLAAKKPLLALVVLGETSRAANWELGGYGRNTNPELGARDIIYYPDVSACGTSTAVSLPCMFAGYGSANHSYKAFLSQENLLDVFKHAGFKVRWIDNNTGDLKIGARIDAALIKPKDDPKACARGECEDSVFLPLLDEILATTTEDTVLVYHQIGSHGPAYFMRYPDGFKPFQPDCRSPDFGTCTNAEIVNAYDNTIAYTDLMLSRIIDRMAAQDRVITSLLYVSDHGESLGENGLYLHAAPLFLAPPEQTKVPMLMWLSQGYQTAFGVTRECLAQDAAAPRSHDNVFHTLLGLADVQTQERDDSFDLTVPCRP